MIEAALVGIVAVEIESEVAGFAVESCQNCHSDQNVLYGHLWILGQNFVGPHF